MSRAALLLVPVVDPADERRDQRHAGLGARHRLGEAEQQRQVAVDPSRSSRSAARMPSHVLPDLDQDAFARRCPPLVEPDQLARLRRRARRVSKLKRASTSVETRPGTIFRISQPKFDHEPVHERLGALPPPRRAAPGDRRPPAPPRRGGDTRLLRRLQQQRRVGRRVLRTVLPHGLDVAGIGNDGRDSFQRVEQKDMPPRIARGLGIGSGLRDSAAKARPTMAR